ncbi:TRAP transporter substrate-binding protein [Alteromonas sp.]|uniref:TRAP transporter substrate-binding protein n=1 Tax=Alteromonas sp. TaxID=232 RepID=UPI000B64E434|nr:TRAP transporter substrate-binding protein [Alteromonas sp.]MAI37025.1 TRAP transporter substrate-binding protein DctP [Alteromonas sp.]OUX89657.1 MAG: C4-dicarboxylate ABC transporter substrate-binding protein [Alteromonas sp. TMED35]
MRCYRLLCLLLLIPLTALYGCNDKGQDETYVIRLGHQLDINHPVHKGLVFLKEELERNSEGKMSIVIYPSSQVGDEREVLELIQIGSMGMTKVSASALETFVPEMKVFSLPYLFNDKAHYWKTLNGEVGKALLAAGEQYRFKGLGYFDAGSRSFYTTKKPVQSPDDLKGQKIRVMNSQTAVSMVNTMGGSATPVSWGELYTSLQQGVVDGAENNLPSFYFSKHYEVSQYLILDEHTSIPDVIIVGTHVWDQLSATQKTWLQDAMKAATEYQKEMWAQSTEKSLEIVKEAGVQVIAADKEQFQQSVAPIYEGLRGSELERLVQQIKALGEKM